MEPFKLTPETLHVQLTQLNEKVRIYVNRLWQLPFAYLTVTGVFFLNGSLSKADTLLTVSSLLALLGLLSLHAISHITRRINKTVDDIFAVEDALSLARTVVYWRGRHVAPYYLILILGIVANIAGVLTELETGADGLVGQ